MNTNTHAIQQPLPAVSILPSLNQKRLTKNLQSNTLESDIALTSLRFHLYDSLPSRLDDNDRRRCRLSVETYRDIGMNLDPVHR